MNRTPSNQELQTGERSQSRTGNVLRRVGIGLTAGATAVVLAVSLSACGEVAKAEPEETSTPVSPSAEASPSPTATETTPNPDIDAFPAELEPYKAMTLDEFCEAPNPEQLTYWSYLAKGYKQFASDFKLTSENPLDVIPVASEGNSFEEIQTFSVFNVRFALSIEDPLDAQKAVCAVFKNSKESPFYPAFEEYRTEFPMPMSGRAQGAQGVVVRSTIKNTEPAPIIQKTADGIPFTNTVLESTIDGSLTSHDSYLVPIPNSYIDGLDSIWINE